MMSAQSNLIMVISLPSTSEISVGLRNTFNQSISYSIYIILILLTCVQRIDGVQLHGECTDLVARYLVGLSYIHQMLDLYHIV